MLVTIFYHIHEFCKLFEEVKKNKLITQKTRRSRESRLSMSEIMTICIYYSHSGYKTFKDYYTKHVLIYMQSEFHNLVSYNRFIELRSTIILPMLLFLKLGKAACTGISYIDSFSLNVCHNRRIYSHKVFKNIAQRGKTSVGWFYGFKIHFIMNHAGEIVDFYITSGNVADNNKKVLETLTQTIFGKLFGDKGYIINQDFYEELYQKGIHLITRVRKNMKQRLMSISDKLLLRKRGTIESSIAILKEDLSIEHTRHRSPKNFLSHILSCLAAYFFKPNKPSILRNNLCIP